ncbi:hypothetical protein Patl1_35792 [Pistacia atlantica]|nr:hypothetical protein Patl1_35792 [Pistacia atlantica]
MIYGSQFPWNSQKNVFSELLRMSDEEFGLPPNGLIKLTCDSTLLEYVMSLLRGQIAESLEKALLTSLATYHCSALASLALGHVEVNDILLEIILHVGLKVW